MVMQFLCPNGHKIHCGEERAGKAAKCPKCGIKFRIPVLDELTISDLETNAPETPPPEPESSSGSGVLGIVVGPAGSDDELDFLCPNNHRLHAPTSLAGQRGKCPQCGSKFRIPSYDELEESVEQEQSELEPTPAPESEEEPEPTPPPVPPIGAFDETPDLFPPAEDGQPHLEVDEGESLEPELSIEDSRIADVPADAHSLRTLFGNLWAHSVQGAKLEIRYGDGFRLAPDRYLAGMSGGSHGVFAVEEPNGTYTLTAVAWETISAVVVHGVTKLPRS